MPSEVIHYNLIVTGRVQGVGFRAFSSRTANQIGLKGYVKNTLDGSVYIEVEGSREILDRYVNECKKGPGWAYVENVTVSESQVQSFKDFKVRY
jgi:acylphosphatase